MGAGSLAFVDNAGSVARVVAGTSPPQISHVNMQLVAEKLCEEEETHVRVQK